MGKINLDGIVYTWHPDGGIAVYFNELVSYLREISAPFDFYSYGGDKFENVVNVKSRFLERYRDFNFRIDSGIFHSTYYRLPENRRSLKVITTVHDFIYERHIGGVRRVVHSLQKNRSISQSDVVICVSENTKKDLLYYIPSAKNKDIRVIYNGVSDDYYKLENVSPSSDPYVLYVGGRAGYKNFDIAVNAVSASHDVVLYIAGGGCLEKNELFLLEKKLKGRYRFFGYVDNEFLNLLYNGALALIYPSSYEGFGIPIAEAMKSGCPVLCSNNSSLSEVGANAARYCEPDPDAFAEGIELFKDQKFRAAVVRAGLLNAKKFSWKRTVAQISEVYREYMDF